MNILVGFGENIQSNPITFNRRNTQMAKNYESENKNSKNSTNRAYESETNSQDCKQKIAAKIRTAILTSPRKIPLPNTKRICWL